MRSKSVVLGYVLAVVLAAVLAVLFIRAFDARGPVWNGGWQLVVSQDATPRVSASEVYRDLTALADDRGVDIVRYAEDSVDPATVRHLYVAGEGTAAELLRDGYGAVDTAITTTVAPLQDLGLLDPRGAWLVGGDRADAEAVLAVIENGGWSGRVAPYASGIDVDTYREYGDLMRSFAVALLAVIVLVGAGTLLRSRAHGVQRLHGAGLLKILLAEWRFLALPVVAFSVGGVAAVALATAALNGLAQLPTVLALSGRLLALLLLAAVVAQILAIALTDGRRLVDQVKGEIDGWWVLLGVYAVRVPAVLVLLAIVAALGQSARVAEVEGRSRELRSVAQDAVTIGIGGYLSPSEYHAADRRLADLAVSQEASGGVIFVTPGLSDQGNVLLVNEGYLRRVEVLGDDGRRMAEVPDGVLTVLEPEDTSAEYRLSVLADLHSWQDTQSSVSDPAPGTVGLPVAEHVVPSGQVLVTLGSGEHSFRPEPELVDPVVVVLPSVGVLAASELVAVITQGGVIFTEPAALPAAIEVGGLSPFVASITPVAYQANEQYRRALGAHVINVIGFVSGGIVVLLTGLVAAVVLVEKDRKRAFVHRLSGLGPLTAHRSGLLLEGVLLTATLALAVVPQWFRDPKDVRTVIDLGTVDTENFLLEQTALDIGVVAASAALLLACLALAHRRASRSPVVDT
ncbi:MULTISPECIES: hypothetical protein [unclassified Rathayibacter]|uniref:hypothetical protein n=1 Tax=unclassified Rathayibacter TaxID=2609250 RepID=UPI00104874C3|nr:MULTISPECIES: hypothetical protein [unclassified Rathayibacter]TCL83215.1 hypothetical protein EDF49_104268 [Rathayibacter sp. PhB192]TCM28713.1 hypothetical protein EDF43_104269 [Rathayibacter sp. PhB179]